MRSYKYNFLVWHIDLVWHNLSFLNHPDQPTFHSNISALHHPEILDYAIATNRTSRLITSCNTWDDVGSDHVPLKVELQLHADVRRYPIALYRSMAKCKWPEFASTLDENIDDIDDTELNTQVSIDERGEALAGAINTALDIACPKQPIKPGAFRVSKETLALIHQKRKIRKLQQATDDPLLGTAYNNLNRRVKAAVAKERRTAWERATGDLNHLQGAQLWKKFNSLTGGKKSMAATSRLQDVNGTKYSGDQEIAEAFASHLEAIHTMHEGPEFCQETRNIVEKEIKNNEHL